VPELKGFRRVTPRPGEQPTVTIGLGPERPSYHGPGMRRVVEPGRFRVLVGGSSDAVTPVGLEVVAK